MTTKRATLLAVLTFILGFGISCLIFNCIYDDKKDGTYERNDKKEMEDISMKGMMDEMGASLKGKKGYEFDKAFLEAMIVHHEGAIYMAEQAMDYMGHPELHQFVQDIITVQTKEINQMKEWQTAWFGTSTPTTAEHMMYR